ncbi:SPARC [Leptidea sinapis]|uniref:SPARC n=1 Tax=Leptidea sinapis TaxID=189913 RepID=UPI0021348824|nr:SPARC [Leptidea sinapis]
MKCGVVAMVALLALAGCTEGARRRHRRPRTTTTEPPMLAAARLFPGHHEPGAAPQSPSTLHHEDEEAERLELAAAEKLDEKRYQQAEMARANALLNEVSGEDGENEVLMDDPCLKVHCSAGRVCEIDDHGEAVCNCIKECPFETDSRRKVCTQSNETWTSDCEVYRQRCLCLDNSELCRGPEYHHVQIEYYGECREMPECSENEMLDFPRRMRDWLFNIMRDLAERSELTPHYLSMEREAETNLTRRWTNAAIWKWCDLDAHDNDRFVSRHELFPIRAPLMSLEHCIAPFLDRCDEDDDHRITLAEWGKCLQLDEFEMEDRCDELTEDAV